MNRIVGFAVHRQRLNLQLVPVDRVPEFDYEDCVRLLDPSQDLAAVGSTYHVADLVVEAGPHDHALGGAATSFHRCGGSNDPRDICGCTASKDCHTPPLPGIPPDLPPKVVPHTAQQSRSVFVGRPGRLAITRSATIEHLASGRRHLVGFPHSRGPIPILEASESNVASALTAYCREMDSHAPLFHVYRITGAASLPALANTRIAIPVTLQ